MPGPPVLLQLRLLPMFLLLVLLCACDNDATELGVMSLEVESSLIEEGVLQVTEGGSASLLVSAGEEGQSLDRSRLAFDVAPDSLGTMSGFVFRGERAGSGTITVTYDERVSASLPIEVLLLPERLEVVSEVPAEAVVGSRIEDVRIRAVANGERPVEGVDVGFTVPTGGGSVTTSSALTDASGVVAATFELGDASGVNSFLASAEGVEPLEVRVTGRPDPNSATIAEVEGDGTSVPAGSGVDLRIRVLDAFGNPVPGVDVDWNFDDGTADPRVPVRVAVRADLTDASGVSSMHWKLPVTADVYTAEATVAIESEPSARFSVEVEPGPLEQVHVSPQLFAFDLGETLQFYAEAQDEYGNAVEDPGTIEWFSSDATIFRVDSDGLVTGVAPGQTELRATVDGLTGSATVSVASGPPAEIQVVQGLHQTTGAGTPYGVPVRVQVLDENGFGTPGEVIGFNADSSDDGEFSPSVATTDGAGIAESVWIAGSSTGPHTGRAALGEEMFALFSGTVVAGPPASITLEPSAAEIRVGASPLSLSLEVEDEFGNDIAAPDVTWTSSNRAVATVDGRGVVTPLLPGTATIRASSGNTARTATVRILGNGGASGGPAADAGGPYPAIEVGGTVAFDGSGSASPNGSIVSWEWDFGDGSTGTGRTTSHRYTEAGTFPVVLTVRDEAGAQDTDQADVVVSDGPAPASVALSASGVSLSPGTSRQLRASVLDETGAVISDAQVEWSSSAPSLVGVTSEGLVQALNPGNAIVTARVPGGPSATAVVTVAFTSTRGGANEPADLAPIVIRPFNSLATSANPSRGTGSLPTSDGGSEGWDDVERQYGNIGLSSDSDAPLSRSGIVSMEYASGSVPSGSSYTPGVMQTQPFTGPAHGGLGLKRLYVHTAFKLSENWENHPAGTELFSLRSTGPDAFEPVLGIGGGSPYDLTVEFQGAQDASLGKVVMAPGAIRPGQWHEIECEATIDSSVGAGDGEFRCWLDRSLVFDKTDVNYSTAAGTDYVWSLVRVAPTWGGTGGNKANTFHLFWDHFYVSGSAAGLSDDAVASLTLEPTTARLNVGGSPMTLTAEARDASGRLVSEPELSWETSDAAVASVDEGGVVTPVGAGTAVITATVLPSGPSATAEVSVSVPPAGGIVFSDGFEAGDMSYDNDGSRWGSSGRVSVTTERAHSGTHSAAFRFGPDDPGEDSSAELRFKLGAGVPELYMEYYLYVPANFTLREEYPNNNKFLKVYQQSSTANTFSVTTEYRYSGERPGALPTAKHRMVAEQTGGRTTENNPYPFIGPSGPIKVGEWNQIRFGFKTASGLGRKDGFYKVWVNGALVSELSDFEFWNKKGLPETVIDGGYLMGWANTGYDEETIFFLDDMKMYNTNPGW